MVRKVVVLFVVLFAVTIDLSESQSFFCNRSEVSNYYVKECANAVRLNPERFSFRCGRFNRRSHALRPNTQLAAAARKHAADMAAKNYFSHRSRDGRSFSDRIRNEGYNGWMIGENLAMGYNSALGAIGGWMCSEGHRRNLLTCQFDEVGTGVVCRGGVCYTVQEYGCSTRNCCATGALPNANQSGGSGGDVQGQNNAQRHFPRRRRNGGESFG